MNNLRFPFTGSETITENYSQAGQDLFVLAALNGKRNGFYLEIGAGPYSFTNNTYLLETKFDWKGVSLDLNTSYYHEHMVHRKHYIELVDGSSVNYLSLLERGNFTGSVIDYVSLDLDGATTLQALHNLPWDKYKISTLTYEHDSYIYGPVYQNASREFLLNKGMVLVAANIADIGWKVFEDWWVDPTMVDKKIIERMSSYGPEAKHWNDYIFQTGELK